jgi:polyisoprenoid-binding protein YceI
MFATTGLELLFAGGTWRVDRAHSVVGFRVNHLMIETVVGRFRDFDGVIEAGETPSVTGSIRAKSLETDHPERDAHLRSPDFFDVERYPEIRFASREVDLAADGTVLVAGNLTIKEVTRPIELSGVFRGAAAGLDGGERIAFDLRGELNRIEYGLTWNRMLETGGILVGNGVELALGIAAVRDVAVELAA